MHLHADLPEPSLSSLEWGRHWPQSRWPLCRLILTPSFSLVCYRLVPLKCEGQGSQCLVPGSVSGTCGPSATGRCGEKPGEVSAGSWKLHSSVFGTGRESAAPGQQCSTAKPQTTGMHSQEVCCKMCLRTGACLWFGNYWDRLPGLPSRSRPRPMDLEFWGL